MDINKTFNTTLDAVSRDGIELSNKMESISKGNMSNEELVQLQFQIGQYNAKLEMLSTITKSMTDMLKSLAQRAN